MKSDATTVGECLAALPEDRRKAIDTVREREGSRGTAAGGGVDPVIVGEEDRPRTRVAWRAFLGAAVAVRQ